METTYNTYVDETLCSLEVYNRRKEVDPACLATDRCFLVPLSSTVMLTKNPTMT